MDTRLALLLLPASMGKLALLASPLLSLGTWGQRAKPLSCQPLNPEVPTRSASFSPPFRGGWGAKHRSVRFRGVGEPEFLNCIGPLLPDEDVKLGPDSLEPLSPALLLHPPGLTAGDEGQVNAAEPKLSGSDGMGHPSP